MTGKLVPELHDIGKLVDNDTVNGEMPGLRLDHHFFTTENPEDIIDWSKWGISTPRTLTWLGIIGHNSRLIHKRTQLGTTPQKLTRLGFQVGTNEMAQLLLLVVADHLAAVTSRATAQQSRASSRTECVTKLWNPDAVVQEANLPIGSRRSLEDLFQWLSTDPDNTDFFKKFFSSLDFVPEEKDVLRAITSLGTHCRLVGKFFGVLTDSIPLITDSGKIRLAYAGKKSQTYDEIETCPFRLVRCKVTFPQHPSRAHDLGVFLSLQDLMQKIESENHVLMHTLDSLWLFLPAENVSPLNKALNLFLDAGFIVEADVAEKPLGDLDSKIFDRPGENIHHIYLYPNMPDDVPPHICELCQMRPASPEPVIDEKSGITEHLCQVCKGFRKLSKDKNKFRKLGGEWEESDIPVAWVRVSLDYKRLTRILTDLFKTYLRGKTIPEEENEALAGNLRDTALMVDFTNDYRKLLSAFAGRIKREMEGEDTGGEHPELLVVALKEKGQALQIAGTFIEEFLRIFPKCEADSPISLAISVSNVKYPFFEHWRYLDKPEDTINIQAVNRALLELSMPKFRTLRGLDLERASSKLHRAAAVGARSGSELMTEIDFLEDLQRYPQLHRARMEQDFSVKELLSYQKIADIGGQS